jgi:voltage-gated potassium channel
VIKFYYILTEIFIFFNEKKEKCSEVWAMKKKYKYLVIICVVFLSESVLLYLFEEGSNEDLNTLSETSFWIVVFLSSGFDVLPETIGGKIVATLLVIEGLILLGLILGGFAAHIIEKSLLGGKIMKKIKFKDHIVICGWTSTTPKILNELTSEDIKTRRKIVVLANCEKNPLKREDIYFVKGDPTKDDDLIKAGIMNANTAIITVDKKSDNPDAEAILTALAVESLNRDIYTCVELEDPENEKHLEHAHVDEIVCLGRLSQNLLVHSSLSHGLSLLFSELVTHNYGQEFYKIPVPNRFVGERFPQAVKRLIEEEGVILTAVEKEAEDDHGDLENQILVNPGYDIILEKGNNIFVIAKEEPEIQ